MSDDHILVKLDQSSEFLAVFLHGNVELLDTVQSELLVLDQDSDWVLHELFSHFNDFWRHGSREKTNLDISGQVFEDLSDFIDESSAEHFISLVKNDNFEEIGFEGLLFDEIFYSAWGSDDNLDSSFFKDFSVFSGVSSSDAASGVDFKKLTEAENDFVDLLSKLSGWGQNDSLTVGRLWIDGLENTDGESGGLAGTGLGLGNGVLLVDNREDTLLLNDGWLFETESIDTSEEVGVQVELLEGVNCLQPQSFLNLDCLFFVLHIIIIHSTFSPIQQEHIICIFKFISKISHFNYFYQYKIAAQIQNYKLIPY